MLLTRAAQLKIQMYIEKQMILNQEQIRNLFGDSDLELLFIKHMIEKKYDQAFKLCINVQDVWLNLDQIQIIINYLDPTINQIMSEYHIFEQNKTSNDFNKLCTKIETKLNKIYTIIYN